MIKKDIRKYLKFHNENKSEISFSNIKILKQLSGIAVVISLIFILMSVIVFNDIEIRIGIFGICLFLIVFFTAMYLISRKIITKQSNNYFVNSGLVILSITVFMIVIIAVSTFLAKNMRGSFFPIFNIIIPTLFILKRRSIITILTAQSLIYIIVVMVVKEPSVVTGDIYLAFSSYIIGLPFNITIYTMRIRDEYFKSLYFKYANKDALTSLPNRRNFNNVFEQYFLNTDEIVNDFSIGVIDIDDFKKYNDLYGHDVGDKIIIEISKVFLEFSRRQQIYIARVGGDEFVFLISNYELDKLKLTINDMIKQINKIKIFEFNNDTTFRISVGVVYTKKLICKDKSLLYKKADTTLYQAKAQGKNRVLIVEI